MKGKASRSCSKPILTMEGTWDQEQAATMRDIFPEECGLAAAIHMQNASRYVYDCLMLQEHRGEDSVGIISLDEAAQFHIRRRVGRVREQFFDVVFDERLPGHAAIGHNRYATQGAADALTNIQPLFFQNTKYGAFAIAHNGTFLDRKGLRERLTQEGVVFQSSLDSEVFGHLIARSKAPTLEEAIVDATQDLTAAYALFVFTREKLIALRDPSGVRPMSMARLNGGFLVCSENYTFDQYPSCEPIGDIQPGEMVVFEHNANSFKRIQYAPPEENFCVFEGIYFSDPRSRYNSFYHEDFRFELGRQIFRENPDLVGDCIIPVLDSGKHAAWGLSEASGIPYREHFKRLHNPPRANLRSFTSSNVEERMRTAYQKLHLRKELIQGKRVVIVDDSVVRSTTIRIINQRLREAGAVEIVNCISSPPIENICPYGMDFQDRQQLVAYERSLEDIRQKVGADRLIYLSLEGLQRVVQETYKCGICSGCFGGTYAASALEALSHHKRAE